MGLLCRQPVTQVKIRNSGIELFRVLCMLAICMQHAVYFSDTGAKGFEGRFWNFGVVGFALITGYYGVSFKISRIIKLWALAIVCACVVGIFGVTLGMSGGGVVDLICSNWYLNGYTVLILLSPLLNAALDSLFVAEDMENLKIAGIAIVALICWSWSQELWGIRDFIPKMAGMGRQSFMALVYIYLVGRCMSKYGLPRPFANHRALIILICIVLIPFLGSYTSPVTILFTALIFNIFEGVDMPNKFAKIINLIVPSLFAVYLLHTNYVGFNLIDRYCNYLTQSGCCRYISYGACALTVFIGCLIVDVPRRFVLWCGKRYM